MGFLLSNAMIRILVGFLVVGGAVYLYEQPKTDPSCAHISHFPNRSDVFQCPAGLNTVVLNDTVPSYATVATDVQTEAWLTKIGDDESLSTLRKNLGAPAVLGSDAFLAVGSGNGLVYINSKTRFLLTIVWANHAPPR